MEKEYKLNRPLSEAQKELSGKITAELVKSEIKTVSFKAEELLIMLPFSEEYDLFALMEKDFEGMSKKERTFSEFRTYAQDSIEKKLALTSPVTLEGIYNVIMKQSGINEEQKKKLMQRECELYLKYVMPRQFGKQLYEKALALKKKIIVTSMGVYPRDIIQKALEKCGYSELNILILHCELNVPASAETSYLEIVLKKAKGKPSSVLHIGGDVMNDVEAPILRGAKALLIQPATPLMVKSGRFRGYVQAKYVYEYDTLDFFALRCALGLYRCYGFDIPQKKTVRSDFCSDPYMLGFLILGSLSLAAEFEPTPFQAQLIKAMESCPEAAKGLEDFKTMFSAHIGDISEIKDNIGCDIPLDFIEKYAYAGDKGILKPYLDETDFAEWAKNAKEPDLAPVYAHKAKKNAVAKLADKLFPPGTRVRTIADGILTKGRKI